MVKISIALSVESNREIQIIHVLDAGDIDNALRDSKVIMEDMLEKHNHQLAYQKSFCFADADIVQGFNGDALYIAIGIRAKTEEDVSVVTGLSEEEVIQMTKGMVNPSTGHCELFSNFLQFPMSFFTSSIQYHEPKFICSIDEG